MDPIIVSPKYIASRWNIIGYILAASAIASLIVSSIQLWQAYQSTGLFDVDPYSFATGSVFLLFVGYVAIWQFSIFFAWLGLRYRSTKETIIAEYKLIDVSPAEAGLLIDNAFGDNELIAILRSLESKGVISISPDGSRISCHNTSRKMNYDEEAFLRWLRVPNSELRLPDDSSAVYQAFADMRRDIEVKLRRDGYLPVRRPFRRFAFTSKVLGILGELIIFALWFMPETYRLGQTDQLYVWELAYIVLASLIVTAVPLYIFLREALLIRNWDTYRRVSGLYMFLKVVYTSRLRHKAISKSERQYYLPYAQAFGLISAKNDPLYGLLQRR